jgi:hypothetical protein
MLMQRTQGDSNTQGCTCYACIETWCLESPVHPTTSVTSVAFNAKLLSYHNLHVVTASMRGGGNGISLLMDRTNKQDSRQRLPSLSTGPGPKALHQCGEHKQTNANKAKTAHSLPRAVGPQQAKTTHVLRPANTFKHDRGNSQDLVPAHCPCCCDKEQNASSVRKQQNVHELHRQHN